MIYQGNAKYPVREICFHTSATRIDWMSGKTTTAKFEEIKRWHVVDNGWKDIGYHWLIDRDGTTKAGRAMSVIGAGVAGHNRGVVHICLLGGHGGSENDRFADHYTKEQLVAALDLMCAIHEKSNIDIVSGHNEYAAKACPCFNVPQWHRRLEKYGYAA